MDTSAAGARMIMLLSSRHFPCTKAFAAMCASQASSHGHGVSLWCVKKRIQQDRFLQSSLPSARYERQRVGVRLCSSPIFEPRFHLLLLNSPLYLQSYLPPKMLFSGRQSFLLQMCASQFSISAVLRASAAAISIPCTDTFHS